VLLVGEEGSRLETKLKIKKKYVGNWWNKET